MTKIFLDFKELDSNKTPIYQQKGTYVHTKKTGFKIAEEALRLANSIRENEYFEEIKIEERIILYAFFRNPA